MRQIYKRLLTTLVLISATQTSSVVQAEGIRLVGPSGEVQSAPRYAEKIVKASARPADSQQPRFFGPTGEKQTLWSIASQLRPSGNVSIQQTLLAIYRINPQAFENQNIHELIPGSRLRVPSLEQVQSATTEQAVAIMKAHEAKRKQSQLVKKTSPVQPVTKQPAPQSEKPQPQIKDAPSVEQPEVPVASEVESAEVTETTETAESVPPVNTSPEGEQQVTELKTKLLGSQSELASLEEKNHRLHLMLSDVQNEVQTLKSELNDEERIRSEVEKLLEEKHQLAIEQQRMQPGALDKILSNGWLVGLAALIPGVLLALLAVMLINRRSKQKEEQAAGQESSGIDPVTAPIGLAAADELEEEVNLDEDLLADNESKDLAPKEMDSQLEDDVFVGLENEELDFKLEGDNGKLDTDVNKQGSSTNGIQVNDEEKALDLERPLDEVPSSVETTNDSDHELPEAHKDNAFSEWLAEGSPLDKSNDAHIDQATLDNLFAELNRDELDLNADSSPVADNVMSEGEVSDNEVDDLLAEFDQPSAQGAESKPDQLVDLNDQERTDTVDESDPVGESDNISGRADSIDIDQDSTELLDELIGFDDEESDDGFDPLNELESLSGFGSENIKELDEDSVELLDELLDEELNTALEEEVSSELDPFDELIREDEEQLSEDELLTLLDSDNVESDETSNMSDEAEESISEQLSDEASVETSFENTPESIEKRELEFTPTPNTVENEFGLPQEEDWLLDDTDLVPEESLEQELGTESTSDISDDEFDFDGLELPDFNEGDALVAMADEPELPDSEPALTTSETDEELEFDESDLPEFGEEDAMASMSESHSPKLTPTDAPSAMLETDNDHDALFDMFAQQSNPDASTESPQGGDESELSGFAESDMESLLSEKGDSEAFEGHLDSDTIDSAGMDLGTMLDVGDDWDGLQSTSDSVALSDDEEVPKDELDIWGAEKALNQPEIAQENWEQQPDPQDFDSKKSQFMTIDELMAQVDQEGGEFKEVDSNLDVGLNESPDVIGDINDTDSGAEAAGKLDLAKIYLEMNDPQGAIKLLEEAIVYGEDDIRREAKNLIDIINGQ